MEHRNAPGPATAVRQQISDGARLDGTYMIMNILATIVASYGLLADSAAVVIGAMVIALLLGPIMGVGLALVDGDAALLQRATTTEVVGVLLVLATAFLLGLLHPSIPAGKELLARTSPTFLDVMIAFSGGAAGAYAMVSPRLSAAFVGVAIATALVPPLSTCSLFLARGQPDLAAGAFLLAVTNMVAIQVAASVVLWCHGYRDILRNPAAARSVFVGHAVSFVVLLGLAGGLGLNLQQVTAKLWFEATVRTRLTHALQTSPGAHLDAIRVTQEAGTTIVRAVVRGPHPMTPQHVGVLEAQLPPSPEGTPLELRVRYGAVTVLNRAGELYTDEATVGPAAPQGPTTRPRP